MILVTPVSELFRDHDAADLISKYSVSLEARPDLGGLSKQWARPVTHVHFSEPNLDIQIPWGKQEKNSVLKGLDYFTSGYKTASFHISRDTQDFSVNSLKQFVLRGPVLSLDDFRRNCDRNASWLRRHFDGRILFENNNYFPTGAYEISTDPRNVCALVVEFADGLLFDIAHAIVSAHNLNTPLEHYLDELLRCDVRQVHMSSPALHSSGVMLDSHGVPGSREIQIIERLSGVVDLENVPATIEYYGDAPRLVESLQMLAQWPPRPSTLYEIAK